MAVSCTLSATPASICDGAGATLTWTTAGGPTSAVIDNGVGPVNPAGGTLVVFPTVTKTYTLTVSK